MPKNLFAWLIKAFAGYTSHHTRLPSFYFSISILHLYNSDQMHRYMNNRISFTKYRGRLSPSPLALPYIVFNYSEHNVYLFQQRETDIIRFVKARSIQGEGFWRGWLTAGAAAGGHPAAVAEAAATRGRRGSLPAK